MSAGCYRYVPVAGRVPDAGADVRVRLTPEGGMAMNRPLGAAMASLEGGVLDATADSLVLRVRTSTTAFTAQTIRWVGERIAVPSAAVAFVERRRIDRRRTMLTVGSVAVATIVAFIGVRATQGVAGGDAPGGGGTPPPP